MCKKRDSLPYKKLFEPVPGPWALRIGHNPCWIPSSPCLFLTFPLGIPPLLDRGRAWLGTGPVDPGRMSWNDG